MGWREHISKLVNEFDYKHRDFMKEQTAHEVLERVRSAGGFFIVQGDRLRVRASKPLPGDLMTLARAHKAELLQILSTNLEMERERGRREAIVGSAVLSRKLRKPNPATTRNAEIRIKGNLSSLKRTGSAKLIVTQYSDDVGRFQSGFYADFTIKVP
tara:strand:+ start:26 stop:496 length:471 start_codon:yes stop_codon:yes gene_type:complete